MESSDDEEEVVLQSVTNYYFVDEKEEPVSFSVLPICLDEKEKPDAPKEEVFLHGDGDGGLQKLFKQVTAWRVGLEDAQPEVAVLTKDNKWIKLLKPRKSYEGSIRTILITVQLLHFLRRIPDSSEKSLWDHLRRVFSTFEDRPSANDLISHYPLIQMIVERDEAVAKSQLLLMLLKERPRKISFDEDLQNDADSKKPFIVDDDLEDIGNDDGDESEEEPDLFDSVCAICDNGGELLCCEGRCMRSFHATRKDGEDSDCKSLGFSRAQVEAIQNFLCRNCKYKQHQCFVCGKLGSSDKSSGAEVFPCVNATCGYFYHPKCVAELLFQENKAEATEYEKKIASGESFTCPVHKCHVCKQGENKEIKELQFAVCRRCPKSYHRKCLPRKIVFEDEDEETEGVLPRAWEGLLPNRILIYCLKHKIDEDLGTPRRNHIIFQEIPEKRKVTTLQKSKEKVPVKKIRKISDDGSRERAYIKPLNATYKLSNSKESQPVARSGITKQALNFQKQLKPLKINAESLNTKKFPKEKANAAATSTSIAKVATSSFPKIDVEAEKKVIALMENISPSLTRESILQKRTMPSTHSHAARNIDRIITLGKVEGAVEAIKTALRKVEDGSTVEDAKAVCEPDVIKQVIRWNYKLKVYLAPFLHGMRYTSFGRHFTKVDKLKEIVDKLQWYVQNGDMIVDFCCGANDFSRLMKEKLDAAGKKCSFKNYDVIQPKNDFNFEKKDWMEVQTKELPTGSQLIMGLNPPFGVKASLANKFINKALTFKPKILILIVPSETERLDRKRSPYDLIWEDSEKLSGKSFYLPGSVDVNDMQIEQWNNKPPPLYLWSRPDWTTKHRAIALKQGHITQVQKETPAGEECKAQRLDDRPAEERISEVSAKERISEVSARQRISEVSAKERILEVSARERISEVSAKERDRERISEVSAKERISEVSAKERISEVSARERISEVSARERISDVSAREHISEVDNKKVATESQKRSSPEDHSSRSAKRRKAKRKLHAEAKKKVQEETKREDQEEIKRRDQEEAKRRVQEEAKNREREAADTRKEGEHSDMSISPPHTSRDVSKSRLPLKTFETPEESFQTSTERPSNQRPGLELGAVSDADRKSSAVEDIVDIARRYTTPSSRDALFSSSSLNWSGDRMGNRDYLIRHSEERYSAYNSLDTSSRNPYADGYGNPLDPDTRVLQSRPYGSLGEDDPLRRNRFGSGIADSVLGRRNDTYSAPSYGLPNSMAFPDSALGRNDIIPSSSYGLSGSMAGSVTSSYGLSGSMAGSVTQRYAPRLDETNTPGAPLPGGRNNMFDPHGMRRDMPPNSFGIAPEPQHPFPRHNSAGWVDD